MDVTESQDASLARLMQSAQAGDQRAYAALLRSCVPIAAATIRRRGVPADRVDDQKYDPALGLTLHAVTVPSPQFVRVNVWMTLWQNPHPDREMVELEVKGENEGIPGLIGVSCGQKK